MPGTGKSMYNSPHQSDDSANMNQSRYSAPPSTSRFDGTKPPPGSSQFFHNHPLSLLNSAASMPHLTDICQPSGPMSLGSSALLPVSATAGNAMTSTSAFLKTSRAAGNDLNGFAPTSQLSKHWIWNSSFFYPPSRHHHQPQATSITSANPSPTAVTAAAGSSGHAEGFQPYFPGSFPSAFAKTPPSPASGAVLSEMSNAGQHHTTSGSDVTSEDSFDPDDAKNPYRTPPPSPSSGGGHTANRQRPEATHDNDVPSSFVELKKKTRNPYSIEELLKKPEPKRARLSEAQMSPTATEATATMPPVSSGISVTTFRPPIIIDDRSRSTMGSPESPTVVIDSSSHSDDDSYKNEAIEICD